MTKSLPLRKATKAEFNWFLCCVVKTRQPVFAWCSAKKLENHTVLMFWGILSSVLFWGAQNSSEHQKQPVRWWIPVELELGRKKASNTFETISQKPFWTSNLQNKKLSGLDTEQKGPICPSWTASSVQRLAPSDVSSHLEWLTWKQQAPPFWNVRFLAKNQFLETIVVKLECSESKDWSSSTERLNWKATGTHLAESQRNRGTTTKCNKQTKESEKCRD